MDTQGDRQARRYQRLADEAYEKIANANNGVVPNLEAVAAAITLPLDDVAAREQQFKLTLARGADKRKLAKGRSAQIDLFSGEPEALDGFMALGDGRRVRVRLAGMADWVANLQLQADNIRDVVGTYQASMTQHALILPYLAQGMTTGQAVAAYQQAQQSMPSGHALV